MNQHMNFTSGRSENSSELSKAFQCAQSLFDNRRFSEAMDASQGIVEAAATTAQIERRNQPDNPSFSIIVLSYKTTPKFMESMAALAAMAHQMPDAELIFVSNAHDGLHEMVKDKFKSFTFIEIGFNLGCSGGRNVGARYAASEILVFLDDDGITDVESLKALVKPLQTNTSVVAVRGSATPSEGQRVPPHYRPADHPCPRYINLEGMSAWRKSVFNNAGGFDILLAGHEGVELTVRLLPFYGYNAFQYEPMAVLYHDYAEDPKKYAFKKERAQIGNEYLDHKVPKWRMVRATYNKILNTNMLLAIAATDKDIPVQKDDWKTPAEVITTVKDGEAFIPDYVRSLLGQTDQNFNIIFIDDGSSDDSASLMQQLWPFADRLTILKSPRSGRAAALNFAIENATADILLIADIDDISIPRRMIETKALLNAEQALSCMSFAIFNEKKYARFMYPATPAVKSIAVRKLFGMPIPFPAFAFRKSHLNEKFNETLDAGIDCDWIHRSLKPGMDGKLIAKPMVYYRTHPKQISAEKRSQQKASLKNALLESMTRMLGDLSEEDKAAAMSFSGLFPATRIRHVNKLFTRIHKENLRSGNLPPNELAAAMESICYSYKRRNNIFAKLLKLMKKAVRG